MRSTGLLIGGLLMGAAIGASLALLYAPKTGTETREFLKGKLKEMEAELDQMRKKMKDKGGDLKDEMKKRVADLEKRIESLMEEYKKKGGPVHESN